MGNYCSSGQSKKDKDNASEKSEESPSYQIVKDKKRKANEAPLAAAEPSSEPSSAATVGTNGFTNTETTTITATTKYSAKPLQNLQSINLSAGDSTSNSPLAVSPPCELLSLQQKLPQNLTPLYGKPTNRQTDKDRKIVLYILAADDGCQMEKSILGEVYNSLNQKCMSKGFELHISDLHVGNDKGNTFDTKTWLNGPLEAQAGHDLAVNCLAEISRHTSDSYLIPILFLSSTLGNALLPLTIEQQDFATVLATADDSGKELLEKWYLQDDKSQPICYRLRANNLELNSEENCEEQLNALLNTIVGVFTKELRDSYLTTVVEQEINNTVMINQELAKRCIWIQNTVQPTKITDQSTSHEIEMNRRLVNLHNDLKNQLSEKHIIKIPPSIGNQQAQFASILETCLSAEIDNILDEHITKFQIPYCTYGVDRRLLCEIEEVNRHSRVLNQNCAVFEIMPMIKKYLDENSKKPLIIYGKSGCGKSVLSATLARTIHSWTPEYNFLLRYANLTQSSRDLTSVIGSITDQLSVLINGVPASCSHDLLSYAEELKKLIENTKQQTIILIDSIDDLIELNDFDWLPIDLLENVKIILTVTSNVTSLTQLNEENDGALAKLRNHINDDSKLLHLSSFKKFQWEHLLSFSRGDFSGVSQLADIWEKCDEKSPLQAKILSWLAWVGVTDIKNPSIEYLCEEVFNFLEKQFTNVIAKFIISIFVASRDGLLETEITSLLENSNLVQGSTTKLWANFSWLMGPLLLHNKNITIMDKIILIVANKHYSDDILKAHQILYDYYNAQPHIYVDKKGKDKFYNSRKFIELPYHTYKLNSDNFNESPFIADISWIQYKLIATGCVHLLNDIYLIINNFKDNFNKMNIEHKYDHLIVLRKFLEINFKALNYDAQQLYSCFMHYIKMNDNSDLKENNKFINNVLETWLNEMYATDTIYYEKLVIVNNDENVNHGYDTIMNLNRKGFFVISLNTEREEICVFDASTSCKIRTLKGVPQPTSLCPVGDYGVAVLCKREIRVIDLDDGKFKVTLKGVMNQKMPYFGLHDPKHLVCLSRNRMYVNLMNLETGDCVTTFKAGEDRFLNSLLVSGDGRILVCGDETQKPFPLLVWHLSQRKLLYDLRIPHHDFQTALSAITHEGSYVCVVAKELSEPTPNFIVVYDLQSGTLFKKWKPSCNTVSLAISQTNTCVIAGLEDARILIWDLVTGNCRCTLIGHNAPVTLLKLDPSGKYLLSSDREGRDMSVRVWELSTGKLLTVYTPSEKVTAGEILTGGKYVVLALENSRNLVTLKLYGEHLNDPNNETNEIYGKLENQGKTFDLI